MVLCKQASNKGPDGSVVIFSEGGIGGYPIPQYRKKNWQLPKYRVKIDEIPIPHLACMHQNQPQTLRENVRRPSSVERSKSTVIGCPSNFVIDCVTLTIESKVLKY